MAKGKRELLVNDEIVHRVDVTGKANAMVEKVMLGMFRNMGDDFFVEEAHDGEAVG